MNLNQHCKSIMFMHQSAIIAVCQPVKACKRTLIIAVGSVISVPSIIVVYKLQLDYAQGLQCTRSTRYHSLLYLPPFNLWHSYIIKIMRAWSAYIEPNYYL